MTLLNIALIVCGLVFGLGLALYIFLRGIERRYAQRVDWQTRWPWEN